MEIACFHVGRGINLADVKHLHAGRTLFPGPTPLFSPQWHQLCIVASPTQMGLVVHLLCLSLSVCKVGGKLSLLAGDVGEYLIPETKKQNKPVKQEIRVINYLFDSP